MDPCLGRPREKMAYLHRYQLYQSSHGYCDPSPCRDDRVHVHVPDGPIPYGHDPRDPIHDGCIIKQL